LTKPKPPPWSNESAGGCVKALVPAELRDGPHPGQWRKERLSLRRHDQLFTNILVGIPGENDDWRGWSRLLLWPKKKGGRLHGLHVIEDSSGLPGTDMATLEQTPMGRRICAMLSRSGAPQPGVPGELALVAGDLVETFVWRAAWNDLAVVKRSQDPLTRRLTERFKQFVQHCSRPILAVPGPISPLDRALLAYDGSPKADEALFVATYLAARWQTALTVVTVETDYTSSAALDKARDYLTRYGVTAEYVSAPETNCRGRDGNGRIPPEQSAHHGRLRLPARPAPDAGQHR
jgi:hypothetical protein